MRAGGLLAPAPSLAYLLQPHPRPLLYELAVVPLHPRPVEL